jgi:Ca-activated chloride channel family protein
VAVAEFGLLLRESSYKQNSSFEQTLALAKSLKANDENGYRSEFIKACTTGCNVERSG